jgi:uncharacterized protein (TIGR02246 family)
MTANSTTSEVHPVVDAYEAAVRAADPEAYAALFDEDVVWSGPGMPPAWSPAEIEARVREAWSAARVEPSLELERVDIDGEVAVAFAHVTGAMKPLGGGAGQAMNHSVLWVLRRRGDGWKIARQVWTSRA